MKKKGKQKFKEIVIPNQTSTPFKAKTWLFDNWQELKWCPKILHHDVAQLTTYRVSNASPLHEWHVCKINARVLYLPTEKRQNETFIFNALSNG